MPNFHLENKILGLLGALWTKNYVKNDACRTTVEVNLDLLEQAKLDLAEAIECTDRHTVPLYHTELWYPITLRDGDKRATDDGRTFYTVARDLVKLPLLLNRITSPSLVWHHGIDFELHEFETNSLTFKNDPFEEELIPAGGELGSRELTLWGYDAKFDRQWLYEHFGIIIDLKMPSSQHYKDILNALYDLMASGVTFGAFETLLNVLLGVPTARSAGEALEGLYFDARGPFVATDGNIYRIPEDASDRVLGGRTLRKGEPLYKEAKILVDDVSQGRKVIVRAPKEKLDEDLLRQALPPEVLLQFE